MGVFEDGFFDSNLDRNALIMKATRFAALAIVLAMQITIGIIAVIKMHRAKRANKVLNMLFIFSLFTACAHTAHAFQYDGPLFIEVIGSMSVGLFFVTLLGTLIFRLYISFRGSVYRMSKPLILIFSVIMVIDSAGWIIFSLFYVYIKPIPLLGLSLLLLYIIGSILAVHYFVSNLKKVALARESTLQNLNLDQIKLDQKQQELSDFSAKYMMLFALAIVSTIIADILALLIVNRGSGLRAPIWALDICINLYLMYCDEEKCMNILRAIW